MPIGASAGAIAAGALASGKSIKELDAGLSLSRIRRIFNPLLFPLVFLSSLGRGILGFRFDSHLRSFFGNLKMSEMGDLILFASVQYPVPLGNIAIGRTSSRNGLLSFSSDIPVWQAVKGSSAMHGIIPPVGLHNFRAEWPVVNNSGLKAEGSTLHYASLEDGALLDYLPLEPSEAIMNSIDRNTLVIAVNLANVNHIRDGVPEHMSFRKRLKSEKDAAKYAGWFNRLSAYPKTVFKWVAQEFDKIFYNLAPFRAFAGYTAISARNVEKSVASVKGKGMKILVNGNYDGALDSLKLSSLKGAEQAKQRGYEFGKELIGILVGAND